MFAIRTLKLSLRLTTFVIALSYLSCSRADNADGLRSQREQLDRTIWAPEVEAQRVEKRIVRLWDDLRRSSSQLKTLSEFPFEKIRFAKPASSETLDLGVRRVAYQGSDASDIDFSAWQKLLNMYMSQGFKLVESEWHHSSFQQKASGSVSLVDFVLHLIQQRKESKESTAPRFIVRGKLSITWSAEADPTVKHISVVKAEVLSRDGGPVFQEVFRFKRNDRDVASAHPIIVHDLDRNGLPEIIISRWNRVYWNAGRGKFLQRPLLEKPIRLAEVGLVADLNRDGHSDFVSVDKAGQLVVFEGKRSTNASQRHFVAAHNVVLDVRVPAASVITAGDIDNDGDVDLFVAQYKPAYLGGQMPTPYYDANDGEPAYLLLNDGAGRFSDVTERRGLQTHRNRRTYSASFFDADGDHDLDLLKVSDYAGVDLYLNDGKGNFRDATKAIGAERHLFGMAHAFGDYNRDGLLDVYAIGMSSTTARRLDAMRLGRDDRSDIHQMRAAMGFGNRMYLGNGSGEYSTPEFAAQVARTGWSWGTTAFDYDLDGDQDVYVANGFRSGDSCEDYCSTFWRHDIYTGDSKQNLQVANLFKGSMQDLNARRISWNGFEHNALLQNLDGKGFANMAFLMGVGCEFDSRSVVAADLDADGYQDLLVSDYEFVGRGFVTSLHVFRNTLPDVMPKQKRHWIGVRLYDDGVEGGLYGTRAELVTDGQKQVRYLVSGDSFASQHDNVFHFGLGDSTKVDQISIRLPSGETTELKRPAIDRYHGLIAE